jgi:hypothetical protein
MQIKYKYLVPVLQETFNMSIMKTSQLTLFRKIVVCCENHMKHINTLCGRNANFLYVKMGGMYSNDCALKG